MKHIGTIIDRNYFDEEEIKLLGYEWEWGQFIFIPAEPMWGV